MLKFEEHRDVTPVWSKKRDRIERLVPGRTRTYLGLGPFRLRVPEWVYELALELA